MAAIAMAFIRRRVVLQNFCRWKGLYSHDHLLATQQGVADELARPESDLAFRHDCDESRVRREFVVVMELS